MADHKEKVPALDTVVVGVDFGPGCEIGLEFVRTHLDPNAGLILVHALELPLDAENRGGETPAQKAIRVEAEGSARQALETLRSKSLGSGPAQVVVAPGEAPHVLALVADDVSADLIVIGPHRKATRLERLLGTTAQKLIHEAHAPVLLATRSFDHPPRRILAPVSPAGGSDRVLAWTAFLAERTGADVTAIYVVDTPTFGHEPLDSRTSSPGQGEAPPLREARSWLEERLTAANLTGAEPLAVPGKANREILETVRDHEIDLIVMGSHGSGLIERLFRANVADLVSAETPVPVLMVPRS